MHAAPALPELQHQFLAALYDDGEPGPIEAISGHGLEPSARLRIYRNSCNQIQTGALRATYPAVLALIGAAFFAQAARAYRHEHPSSSGNLQRFGTGFADYLETLPSLGGFPYVPDVARLEWLRQKTVLAADAEPIQIKIIAQHLACADESLKLRLHPSVHTLASRHPVLTIWRYAMDPTPETLQLTGTGEPIVLWRENGEVAMDTPDTASFGCIEVLTDGGTLADAHAVAKAIDPDFDLPACIGSLVARGLIAALHPIVPHQVEASCH